jgi:uncharacterized membrane protein YgcG
MFTGITSQVGALVTAIVVLTGGAILRDGAAAADPNQDEQFLALLEKKDIPATKNVPSVIAFAHTVCGKLDDGMPADDLVDAMVNYAYSVDPSARRYAPGRLARTEARFITAAVEVYCPGNESKIVSIVHRVAAYTRGAVNSRSDLRKPPPALDMINMPAAWQEQTRSAVTRLPRLMSDGVFVGDRYGDDRPDWDAGDTVFASLIGAVPPEGLLPPNPPQIPPPPPPTAQLLKPPRPIAAPPPPQQPPPPPQQPPPPAVAPQPGGAAGGGGGGGGGGNGGGGNGGGGPVEPTPAMPPGFVRVAP